MCSQTAEAKVCIIAIKRFNMTMILNSGHCPIHILALDSALHRKYPELRLPMVKEDGFEWCVRFETEVSRIDLIAKSGQAIVRDETFTTSQLLNNGDRRMI